MNHSFVKTKDIIGYIIMASAIGILFFIHNRELNHFEPTILTILYLSTASAVITKTISIFWLWKEERVQKLENVLGIIGHIPHCGYCLSLWIAAFFIGIGKISLFNNIGPISFFLSWWALGFLNLLAFEIITILWFIKVKMEFQLRDLYNKRSQTQI